MAIKPERDQAARDGGEEHARASGRLRDRGRPGLLQDKVLIGDDRQRGRRERRALRAARAGILRICSHERFNCYYGLGIRAVSDLRLRSLVSFIARSYTAVLRLGSRSTS